MISIISMIIIIIIFISIFILIYNLNVDTCIWIIIERLVLENKIKTGDELINVMTKTYEFFKNYNNNYRPIYHLERIAINLIQAIPLAVGL